MKIKKLFINKNTLLKGPLLIKNTVFFDERGYFKESWNQKKFNEIIGSNEVFVQDNHSLSYKGVLRGMHYQRAPMEQGKLLRCIKGKIFDVLVDIRKDSQTNMKWIGLEIDSNNHELLWVPKGFAHGFLTLSDEAEVQYKTTEYWSKEHEETIKWDDPQIAIKWPITKSPKVSEKDNKAKNL